MQSLLLNKLAVYFTPSQKALYIRRQIGNRAGEGETLHNIGAVYDKQGNYQDALEYYQQSLSIMRQIGNQAGEGATLHNISGVYHNQGLYAEALEQYQLALSIIHQVGDRFVEGAILHNIGLLYSTQGNYQDALKQYQQALDITRQVGNRADEGTTVYNIGFVYQQQGQFKKALTHYELAMAIFEELRAVAGSEEGRASFIAQHADFYDNAVKLYHEQGQDSEAFSTSERARSRSFLDSMTTGEIQLYDDEAQALWDQELATYNERQAIQDALAQAKALNPPDPELVVDLEQQLDQVEEAHSAALSAIEARGGQLADLVPGRTKRVSLSEIQADLPENTTLVSYHREIKAKKNKGIFFIT